MAPGQQDSTETNSTVLIIYVKEQWAFKEEWVNPSNLRKSGSLWQDLMMALWSTFQEGVSFLEFESQL